MLSCLTWRMWSISSSALSVSNNKMLPINYVFPRSKWKYLIIFCFDHLRVWKLDRQFWKRKNEKWNQNTELRKGDITGLSGLYNWSGFRAFANLLLEIELSSGVLNVELMEKCNFIIFDVPKDPDHPPCLSSLGLISSLLSLFLVSAPPFSQSKELRNWCFSHFLCTLLIFASHPWLGTQVASLLLVPPSPLSLLPMSCWWWQPVVFFGELLP